MPITSCPLSHQIDAAFDPIAEPHVGDVLRRVDDGDGPEQDVGGRFVQRVRKVKKIDVVGDRIDGVPRQRLVADGHRVTVMRYHGELIRKVLLLHDCLHGTIGELRGDTNRLEDEPTLKESRDVRRLGR